VLPSVSSLTHSHVQQAEPVQRAQALARGGRRRAAGRPRTLGRRTSPARSPDLHPPFVHAASYPLDNSAPPSSASRTLYSTNLSRIDARPDHLCGTGDAHLDPSPHEHTDRPYAFPIELWIQPVGRRTGERAAVDVSRACHRRARPLRQPRSGRARRGAAARLLGRRQWGAAQARRRAGGARDARAEPGAERRAADRGLPGLAARDASRQRRCGQDEREPPDQVRAVSLLVRLSCRC